MIFRGNKPVTHSAELLSLPSRRILFFSLLLYLAITQCSSARDGRTTVSILSSDNSGIKFQVLPGSYPQDPVTVQGRTFLRFEGAAFDEGDQGKPLLPTDGVLLGIPVGARVTLELVQSTYETIPEQLVAPVPRIQLDEDRNAHEDYIVDEAAYSSNTWTPPEVASLDGVSELRHQRVVKVLFHPFQYNPATRQLRKLTSLTLNLRFTFPPVEDETKSFRSVRSDPYFEEVYKSLLSNYEEAKKWRARPVSSDLGGIKVDTLRDWFDPTRPYLKLSIVRDGLYKITDSDIYAAGVDPSTINPRTLKLYHRGLQVPVYLEGEFDGKFNVGDYIEFYARRNYGKGQYFDRYTDTSAYWLTWGGANGMRMTLESTDSSGTPATYFMKTIHLEQDLNYYYGYSEVEIIQPEDVRGEGWFWNEFFPGTTNSYSFSLEGIHTAAGVNASIRVRFNGMSQHFTTPDHIAKVTLNGTILGQVEFDFNYDTVFTATFPPSVLREGSNSLTIQSLPTQAQVNKFYMDWFEISYPSQFRASSNELTFTSEATSGPVLTRYTVSNFQSSAIDVYNLSDGKKFAGGIIASQGARTYSITFRDTGSTSKQYIVVVESQKLKPARVERKQFSDIRINPAGADYIIITHVLFKQTAQRLADYRASQLSLRTSVIDIQDIYDEFNFGIFNPEAIKPFLRYAYERWQSPAPTFVLLLGDASWDFKFLRSNTVKRNFVPAYGNPPTDNWFVSFDSGSVVPSMFIGRIPAENSVQAEQVVEKLIQYDRTPLGEWVKNFLFITGGNTDGEKLSFNSQAESFINAYVTPAPVGGTPFRVYKTTDAIIDGENKQLIQDIISEGTLFLNFIGHSGGRIWGVDAGDPNALRNTNGQFVFISSVSCNVAAFADPVQNVLTEDWLLANQRAAIGAWAGSSLGYIDIGRILTDSFLRSMARDTVRNMGKLTTIARIDLWKVSPTSPRIIAGVGLHPLLGDPTAALALPTMPELEVREPNVSFQPAVPAEVDSIVRIRATIKNFGLVPRDSVQVRLADNFNGSNLPIGRGTYSLPSIGTSDSLIALWDVLGKAGNHVVSVQIDPANRVVEVSKLNNQIELPVQVFASKILPLRPAPSSVVPRGSQVLEINSPTTSPSALLKYFFEVDTSAQFNSPRKVASPAIDAGVLTSRWTTPPLTTDGLYYWRTRSYDGRDTSAWMVSSFLISASAPPAGKIRWSQRSRDQFTTGENYQTEVTDSGVTIVRLGGIPIYVRSLGYRNNADRDYYSIIRVGPQTATGLWWEVGSAFMVARISELSGEFQHRPFDVQSSTSLADSMARYLAQISPDDFIGITVIFDGYTNVNENLYLALESLGAQQIRSVRPGESWALLAQKRTGFVRESYSKDGVAEVSYVIPSYYRARVGRLKTGKIGPARRWNSISWENNAPDAGTDISLRIIDARTNAVIDTLPKTILVADLSGIDAKIYPALKLQAFLYSNFGTATPVLKTWSVDYEGPPDLAIAPQLVSIKRDSVLEGEPIEFTVEVHNIGYTTMDSLRVNFYTVGPGNTRQLFASVRVDTLEAERSKTVAASLNTVGRRATQTLVVALDPLGQPELYDINNTATRTFYVRKDTVPPELQVTFDGLPIVSGDYVSAQPTILVRLFDNSPLAIRDTGSVTLRLDNRRILYAGNPQITFDSTVSGNKKVEVQFRPTLEKGGHTLLVDARDASENLAGGATYRVDFSVETTPQLLNVYNYPNPFPSETDFTFNLTGAHLPDNLTIKIYTVAGRLIRSIEVPVSSLRFGFNRVRWDGRDNDGNEVANGVYFYSLVLKNGESTVVQTQRMAKVR